MNEQNAKVSRAFRHLADLLESIDTTGTDLSVTHATPVSDDLLESERVAVELGVQIPFLDESNSAGGATLTPTDVRFEHDGTLHVDLRANVGPGDDEDAEGATRLPDPSTDADGESESDRTREDEPVAESSESRGGETDSDATTEAATGDETQAERHESGSAPANERVEPGDGDEAGSSSDGGERSTVENGEPGDVRTDELDYRDPDRLRAVYEEYETFGEMTEALDVDVTSQTVRRYMIKYGIHEPLSSTGSRTVATLVDADPDDIGSAGNSTRPRRSGDPTETATSESEEYPVSTAEAATE